MATAELEAFFVIKFECFSNKAFNKKEIRNVQLKSTIGHVISRVYEDQNIKVSSVLTGEKENDVNCFCELDTPFSVIRQFGHKYINVSLKETKSDENNNTQTNNESTNILNVMMACRRTYESYPPQREQQNEKDHLYNVVIQVLKTNKIGFTAPQVRTVGTHVVQTLTDFFWYLDPFHERLNSRAVKLPDMFKDMKGYRNFKKQHKKVPQIVATELKEKADCISELLLLPWLLNKSFAQFRDSLVLLVNGVNKYHKFMIDMRERTVEHSESKEPVRSLDDSWTIQVFEGKTMAVKPEYSAMNQAVSELDYYAPLDLCNFEPSDKQDRRKWIHGIQLSASVSLFVYRYGNYLGNVNILWKIPRELRDRSADEEVRIVTDIKRGIMKFATRRMRKDFIDRYSKCFKLQPAILRSMYQFLTSYEHSPLTEKQEETDLRVCQFLLEGQDSDLIFDLRQNNGRPEDPKFDPFWDELQKYLDEKSAVHERRQNDIQYLPFAISVEDLRNQILERLPPGSDAPSVSWLRLNLFPTNPYNKSAVNYTGRFHVKYAVQQRLMRVQHQDSGFGRYQFKILKCFACKWRDYALFQCLDDKAIIPVGNPGHPVSTGVRAHHGGLVGSGGKIVALDHDFHLAGLIPSVCFHIVIPENSDDSFYDGSVFVTVKDKIFQPSSPQRHSAETVSIVRDCYSEDGVNMSKPILIRYTDGGPDHRTTYRSVQLCCLVEFIALDLDMTVCARAAPSQSYHNPAEHIMSLLNLALQNVALERPSMPPEFELQAKSHNSLSQVRNSCKKNAALKTKYIESLIPPKTLIMERFKKLKWKGENVHVNQALTPENIQDFIELLEIIDHDVSLDDLSKLKSKKIDMFLEKHGRRRHHMFQIMKCQSEPCSYCVINPPRIPEEVFQELHFVPDPVLGDDGTYKVFADVYGTNTTDEGRPSLRNADPTSERDKLFKNLFTAAKVRGYAICCECGKRRVIYSAKKLSVAEVRAVTRVQEELLYICGNPLFPGVSLQDTVVVKESITCSSPMEAAYYAGVTQLFDEVCFHCGDTEVEDNEEIRRLKEEYGIVRPICNTCREAGKPVKTRNALKIKKRK